MLASSHDIIINTPKSIDNAKAKLRSFTARQKVQSHLSPALTPISETASLDRVSSQPLIQLFPAPVAQPEVILPPPINLQIPQPVIAANNQAQFNDSDSEDEMSDQSDPLLPNFTGSPNQNAIDWLACLEEYCMYKQFNGPKRLAFFKLKLADIAKVWLLALPDATKNNFDNLSAAFRDRFQPREAERHRLVRDLFGVKQLSDESVDAYLSKLLRRAQQCGVDDAMTIHAAMSGLRSEVSNFCLERNPTTFEELIAAARLGEMTRPASDSISGALNLQMESLANQLSKINEKMTQLTAASINPAPTQRPPRAQTFYAESRNARPPQQQQQINRPRADFRQPYLRRPTNFDTAPFSPTPTSRPPQFGQNLSAVPPRNRYSNSSGAPVRPERPCPRCANPRGHPLGVECHMKHRYCHFCSQPGHSIKVCGARARANN